MKYLTSIEEYLNQPFTIRYSESDIERTKDGFKTKDGKYHTSTDKGGYSYWRGEDCYPDISYGYLFLGQPLVQITENLNKTLDDDYKWDSSIDVRSFEQTFAGQRKH